MKYTSAEVAGEDMKSSHETTRHVIMYLNVELQLALVAIQ